MTETAERDTVQDQLCARIDELEREKEILNSMLDRAEEKLANVGELGTALQRIGTSLDLDPGADLTVAAPAKVAALAAFRSAVCGWRESDWPEGLCRRTAELVADHGRQAEESRDD